MNKKIFAAIALALAALVLTVVLFVTAGSFNFNDWLYRNNDHKDHTIHTQKWQTTNNDPETLSKLTAMKVISGSIKIYESGSISSRAVKTFDAGSVIEVMASSNNMWEVYENNKVIGYCLSDNIIPESSTYYAELAVENGEFTSNAGQTYKATSHLVDVKKYNKDLDIPMVIDMYLSRESSSGHSEYKFYDKGLCLLQYNTVQKLIKAQSRFNELGYTIKICDAYRPTSVQWSWWEMVKVHKWVAKPTYGDGGIHDRGIAVDMTLVKLDSGETVQMATEMHTFSDASSRNYAMTAEQREILDMMTGIMLECGFSKINSEWWHYQEVNKNAYLPTDHPIDSIPLVLSN